VTAKCDLNNNISYCSSAFVFQFF